MLFLGEFQKFNCCHPNLQRKNCGLISLSDAMYGALQNICKPTIEPFKVNNFAVYAVKV
jgi:hypothetical protein